MCFVISGRIRVLRVDLMGPRGPYFHNYTVSLGRDPAVPATQLPFLPGQTQRLSTSWNPPPALYYKRAGLPGSLGHWDQLHITSSGRQAPARQTSLTSGRTPQRQQRQGGFGAVFSHQRRMSSRARVFSKDLFETKSQFRGSLKTESRERDISVKMFNKPTVCFFH